MKTPRTIPHASKTRTLTGWKTALPGPYRRLLGPIIVVGLLILTSLACSTGPAGLSGPELTATYDTLVNQIQTTAGAGGGEVPAPTAEVAPPTAEVAAPAPTAVAAPTDTVEPAPTVPGAPAATANVNANVREGPGVNFKAIGALLTGQSATIEGRNANNTWFLISFPAGPGGKGWIAASTVVTSGDVNSIPVVQSPPTYTPTPTATPTSTPTRPTATPSSTPSASPTRATATPSSTPTASPTTAPAWQGAWNVVCPGFGPCSGMNMTQTGNNVGGSFTAGTEFGSLSGTVTGNTLNGTFSFPGRSPGQFSFTLTGGGQQFTGTWEGTPFCGARPGTSLPSCP